jgi:uncharacterized membrane protein YbhN (UPF0104 family)
MEQGSPRAVPLADRTPQRLPDGLRPAALVRRIAQLGALAVVAVLLISTLPGLDDVRERFAHAQAGWLVALAVVELASCLSYVVVFRGVFCGRLDWGFSYQVGLAEQATNVLLPAGGVGGLALGAWVLRQGGMSGRRIARRSVAFFVLTSAPNFLCAAVLGFVVLGSGDHGSAPAGLTLALAALATLAVAVVAALPWIVARLGAREPGDAWLRRPLRLARRGARSAGEGVQVAAELLRGRERGVVAGSVGYMAFDVAALAAAFAALGDVPGLATFVFAYVVGQLGGLIPLPGGIGGTDGGLIAVLSLYGSPLAQSTAAVLAYRALQLGLPAILGTIAFVQLRRTLARGGAPAALCEPSAGEPLPVLTIPAR